jgi:hypothetical protein
MTMRAWLIVGVGLVAGCGGGDVARDVALAERDSGFAALQERGEAAMGVDQYESTHQFDVLDDGGRIELQYDSADPAEIEKIRQHLQEIAAAFDAGDFETPGFVHAGEVPGVDVMKAKRDVIVYEYHALPRGGEVRITTADAEAREAIRRFMHFQRGDHHDGGHDSGHGH